MVDIIIVLIVIVLLGFALKGSIKHFKGEGPCCGGGSGSSKKAKTKFKALQKYPQVTRDLAVIVDNGGPLSETLEAVGRIIDGSSVLGLPGRKAGWEPPRDGDTE